MQKSSLAPYQTRVAESFGRQAFMNHIHAKLKKVELGTCEIQMEFASCLTQQHGFFHAGAVSSIADSAAGYAAFSVMNETSSVLTVEFKINLLAPATGEALIAKANVLKKGKTLTICRSDVFAVKDGHEHLVAAAQVTLIELAHKADQ